MAAHTHTHVVAVIRRIICLDVHGTHARSHTRRYTTPSVSPSICILYLLRVLAFSAGIVATPAEKHRLAAVSFDKTLPASLCVFAARARCVRFSGAHLAPG